MLDLSIVKFPSIQATAQRGGVSWLYVFACGEFVKVGRAQNPVSRLANVAGSMPFDVSMWGAYRAPRDMVVMAEAYCHCILAEHHHRGEWFRVDPDLALQVVREVARLASAAIGKRTAKFDIGNCQGAPIRISGPRSRHFRQSEHFLVHPQKEPLERA